MTTPIKIKVHPLSAADALGYRGQKAVADTINLPPMPALRSDPMK